jgi:hypothetical protein
MHPHNNTVTDVRIGSIGVFEKGFNEAEGFASFFDMPF